MLVFGHLGITLGAAAVMAQLVRYRHRAEPEAALVKAEMPKCSLVDELCTDEHYYSCKKEGGGWARAFEKLGMGPLDVLFCLVGAMLPDIFDKPAGHFLFREVFGNNGRIFSHSLLFGLVVLGLTWYLYRSKKATWAFYLAFGVFMHLVLDLMWQNPQTLFWPLAGWSFPRAGEYEWLSRMVDILLYDPAAYIPEIIGVVIIGIIGIILIKEKGQKPGDYL
jgi:membrane-bound metal-dependent hydrolase YbcI (DUF457 family)